MFALRDALRIRQRGKQTGRIGDNGLLFFAEPVLQLFGLFFYPTKCIFIGLKTGRMWSFSGKNFEPQVQVRVWFGPFRGIGFQRSEEHTSDSSHVKISYAVFCLKKKKNNVK